MAGTMVSGVVLAAGRSARLGRPKQLLPLAGEPLLTHVLRSAAAAALTEVVLVLGHEAADVAAAVGEWGQRTVVNPDFASGQSSSLRAGIAAVDPGAEAALILLGDQPQVGPPIINAVIDRYAATGGPIVVALYAGTVGNPVLFDRALFPDLLRVSGDQGARSLLRDRPDDVVAAEVGSHRPPSDVDTEEDYAALLAAWGERGG